MQQPSAPVLLDVREKWEWEVAHINKATLLPMSELQGRVGELDRSKPLVVYCHSGQRSAMVADWLRAQGFQARNLTGGIDRWSLEVDPSLPQYELE